MSTVPRALRPPLEYGPLPFHRLYRGLAGFRPWRPIVALVVGTAIYLALSMVFFVVLLVAGILGGIVDLGDTVASANDALNGLLEIDAASPFSLVLALGSVALMLPSALLGQLAAGLRPLGVRHSVAFRIRWRWFAVSLVPALVTLLVALAVPAVIALAMGAPGEFTTDPGLFAVCAVLILVITPFQAAAEEYVFRGLLAQSLGSWVRFAPVGWIVTTVLFTAGHAYDVWGLLSVGAFGFAAAVVVSRTGGLEAGIALHTVNNVASFLILASGVQGTTVNPTSSGSDVVANLVGLGVTLITTAAWVLWVERLARRRGLATRGGMLVPPAPPAVQDSADTPAGPHPTP